MIQEISIMNKAAKSVRIVDYMASKGFEPCRLNDHSATYLSPFTEERDASFTVSITKNVFNDFSSGKKGDVIDLCFELGDFRNKYEAIRYLANCNLPRTAIISRTDSVMERKSHENQVIAVYGITNIGLITYAADRGIKRSTLNRFCSQVHYSNAHGSFYAIGFRHQFGYALRSRKFKCNVGGASYSIIIANGVSNSRNLHVFEGFFSFMSWFQHQTIRELKDDVLVLNSVANLNEHALGFIKLYEKGNIYSWLDNDTSGVKALEKVQKTGVPNLYNASKLTHPNHNDYNDYYISLLK